jgi:hypothetical protein
VSVTAESSTSLRVSWQPPPEAKRNGRIAYYKIFVAPAARPDAEATVVEIKNADLREYVLDELRRFAEYRVWMLAGTAVGDGPASQPVTATTDEDGRNSAT